MPAHWVAGLWFIPAGAGNTYIPKKAPSWRPVHPRRRGEHIPDAALDTCPAGSSPQARGTQSFGAERLLHSRFIPAGAGNTPGLRRKFGVKKVHPRRRGEHRLLAELIWIKHGSSPQARGTLSALYARYRNRWFIPAGAGNTTAPHNILSLLPVHPRRRGEHKIEPWGAWRDNGSSPQARGTLQIELQSRQCKRFIPAGAGNTRHRSHPKVYSTVHPRRRGEHPNI